MVRISQSLLLLVASHSAAGAAYVRHAETASPLPFEIAFQHGSQATLDVTLEIENDASSLLSVVAWQLELELRLLDGSFGAMHFDKVVAPPNSLFGQIPGPLSIQSSSKEKVLVFDGKTASTQQAIISQHSARGIVQLSIMPTPEAIGSFQLIMPQFDVDNPDLGSSWLEEGKSVPTAFENWASSEFPGFVLLGTITVHSVPEPTIPLAPAGLSLMVGTLLRRWRRLGHSAKTRRPFRDNREEIAAPGSELKSLN